MSSMAKVSTALALLIVLAATPAYAAVYTVGESSGWTSGTDYNTWLSGKTFNVGDSLLFSYSMLHSVYEVSKSDYDSCTSTNSLQSYTDGSSTIKLTAPGTRYFVCGTFGHCTGGMKLAVNVGSAGTTTNNNNTPAGTNNSPAASTPSSTTTTNNPSTKTTESTNAAAAGIGFHAASGAVMAGVSALVGLTIFMG